MRAAAALLAVGLLASPALAAPAVILPGVLDLPVTAGRKDGEACKVGAQTLPRTATMDCVTLPGKDVDAAMKGYIKTLRGQGWAVAGGAAIQIWLERPRPDGQCDRVNISALADFSLPQAQMMKAPGIVAFEQKPPGPCRAKAG